jgi:hypothetical protein
LLKRASEAEAKLKRLYDATENGVAGVSDPPLKERVTELKAIRDQARADAERAEGAQARGAQDLRQPSPQACGPRAAAIAATTCARWPSAPKWTRKRFASWARRACCFVRLSRLEAQNGGFWRAQFCTEVVRRTRFERVTVA